MGRVTISIPSSSRSSSEYSDESLHRLLESGPSSPASQLRSERLQKTSIWKLVASISLMLVAVTASVIYISIFADFNHQQQPLHLLVLQNGSIEKLISDKLLEPSPVLLPQSNATANWTIYNPSQIAYPRPPFEIARLCHEGEEMANYARMTAPGSHSQGHAGHFNYYHVDTSFVDTEIADMGMSKSIKASNMCRRTLTYVLESSDPGLGRVLMGLWMSYGFAQKEGRTFFIDDRRWAYGKYSAFFRPLPKPECSPPLDTLKLPYPNHARHLLVSSATTQYTFGHDFHEEYDNPRAIGVQRQELVFKMLMQGHGALFHLVDEFPVGVSKEMRSYNTRDHDPRPLIGVHVRHGDHHPYEFHYRKSHVPPSRYASAIRDLINFNHNESGVDTLSSKVFLASDDDAVFSTIEPVALAGRGSDLYVPAEEAMEIYIGPDYQEVDSPVFPGGFSNEAFWHMGSATNDNAPQDSRDGRYPTPSQETLRSREKLVRSYLSDLVLLSSADDIVCATSSTTCRVLAVMMGWQKAIVRGKWHNIDGDFDWKSIAW